MWYTTHRTQRLPNQGCREESAFSSTNEHGDQGRFYTTMNIPTSIKSLALAFSLVHSFVYVQVFDVVKRHQKTTMLRLFHNDDIWCVWISMESLDRKSLRKIFTLLSGTDIELRSPQDFCDRDETSDLNRTQWQEHHGRRQDQRRLIFVTNHLSVYDHVALRSFIPIFKLEWNVRNWDTNSVHQPGLQHDAFQKNYFVEQMSLSSLSGRQCWSPNPWTPRAL